MNNFEIKLPTEYFQELFGEGTAYYESPILKIKIGDTDFDIYVGACVMDCNMYGNTTSVIGNISRKKSQQQISAEHAVTKAKEALKAAEEALEKAKLV